MQADRKRWNAKYQQGGGGEPAAPDAFFLECLDGPLARPACALELAAGRGRQALELARRGWRVAAWDVSDEALVRLDAAAAARGVAVETRRVDLDEPLPAEERASRDLVVIVNYLDRELLLRAHELLREGGQLLIATFTTDREGEHPSERWCLAPGELARGVEGFETLLQREAGGRAGWLGRLVGRD